MGRFDEVQLANKVAALRELSDAGKTPRSLPGFGGLSRPAEAPRAAAPAPDPDPRRRR